MARQTNLAKLTYPDLIALRAEIEGLLVAKKEEEKISLRQKLAEMAKGQGFELADIFGKGGGKGTVAVKYRDPKNPANTWTGRGLMPRWMTAATKTRGVKKEHFLI